MALLLVFAGQYDISVFSDYLPLAFPHSAFISEQLAASCARGETAGPFALPPFQFMRCSGIGAVPKKNGNLRMIHHLCILADASVNDSIPAEPFSLHYVSIDYAINIIMSCPQPVYLSKLDVRSAFRQHEFAMDHLLHYLDDFLNISTGLVAANQQLAILLRAFTHFSIPLAPSKLEGPSPSLTFLGIVLDCERRKARLPEDKLSEIRALLVATISERSIGQRQVESLLGKLDFAARVIVPGRTFMRRLWSVCSRYREPHYRIKLSNECIDALTWWLRLLQDWNGKFFFLHPQWTRHLLTCSYLPM
ncbi:uncharacterized protein LOC135823596 [Sycon ciliatum]|uniref:uncharacterized protein LOC135823596 n=1 Tax=Sycon ciliatum TaxID=27933 RepID=UPI0031F70D85